MNLPKRRLITTKNAEIGNEVVLVNVSRYGYTISPSNPLINTEFECVGIIDGIQMNKIGVAWNNGCHNVYHNNTLALASNSACVSIWN